MAVTTGGITVTVGAVMVVALGVAGVATVRDDTNDGSAKASKCSVQTRAKARAAMNAFMAEYVEPDPEAAAKWFVGGSPTGKDAAGDKVQDAREAGLPASLPLKKSAEDGWVLLVLYNPDADRPSLPSCFEDTPVVYVGSGPFAPD